jgi:hypothetical protein
MQSYERQGAIRQFPNVQYLTIDFVDSRLSFFDWPSAVLAINRFWIIF